MKKNETTIIWILGIAVAVLLLAQFTNIGEGVFAIAGGGAGSSVSQIIEPISWNDGSDIYSLCIARPPVGETWLITAFYDDSGYCSIVKGEYQDYNWVTVPTTDRLFIDHDAYLMCGDYWGSTCDSMVIVGVRV